MVILTTHFSSALKLRLFVRPPNFLIHEFAENYSVDERITIANVILYYSL